MHLWQVFAAVAAVALLAGLVLRLLYLPAGPGPFDADEGD